MVKIALAPGSAEIGAGVLIETASLQSELILSGGNSVWLSFADLLQGLGQDHHC